MHKLLTRAGLMAAGAVAVAGLTAGSAAAAVAPTTAGEQPAARAADTGPYWHDMGHYGEAYRPLCHYHRDTYRAIGRPADCVANPYQEGELILWVWF